MNSENQRPSGHSQNVNHHQPQTTVNYLPQIARFVEGAGIDTVRWLKPVGLHPDMLENAGLTISVTAYVGLIERASELTDEPALGILVGSKLTLATHGPTGLGAMSASSILEAMQFAVEFIALRTPLVMLDIDEKPNEYHLIVRPIPALGSASRTVVEATVAALKVALNSLCDADQVNKRIHFSFPPPDYAELVTDILARPIHYDQESSCLVLDRDEAHKPIAGADALVFAEMMSICQKQLKKLSFRKSIVSRVESCLQNAESGFPTLEQVSQQLNMTSRTLHRRLAAENSSFRTVVEKARKHLAYECLQNRGLSVQETAGRLGYTDTANFRRAFKRWYNKSPTEFLNES